jgi:hypothetical protein
MSTHRKVDVEHPAPCGRLNDGTTDIGPDSHPDKINTQNVDHVVPPFPQGHKVRYNDVHNHVYAATPHPLDSSTSYQHTAVDGSAGQPAAESEQGNNQQGDPLAAKNIGKLPEQRLNGCATRVQQLPCIR